MGPPFIGRLIQNKEKDFYHDKNAVLEISSEANHYYHSQSTCIMRYHPYFHARPLQLDPETLQKPMSSTGSLGWTCKESQESSRTETPLCLLAAAFFSKGH